MKTFINWFKAEDIWYLNSGAWKDQIIFTGPNPYDFDTRDLSPLYKIPWVISHPKARKDCLYKLIALETYAIGGIYPKGMNIGIVVEEIHE